VHYWTDWFAQPEVLDVPLQDEHFPVKKIKDKIL
jgi:hypothetical protein